MAFPLFCNPQPANTEISLFFVLPFLSMLNRFCLVLCPISLCVYERGFSTWVLGLASEYVQYTMIAYGYAELEGCQILTGSAHMPFPSFCQLKGENKKGTVVVWFKSNFSKCAGLQELWV